MMQVTHNTNNLPWYTRFSNWLRSKLGASTTPIQPLRAVDSKPLLTDEQGNVRVYPYLTKIVSGSVTQRVKIEAADKDTAEKMALMEFVRNAKVRMERKNVTKRNDDKQPVEWKWVGQIQGGKNNVRTFWVNAEDEQKAKEACLLAFMQTLRVSTELI